MNDTVTMTHPDLPGVTQTTTRKAFDLAWSKSGWVEQLPNNSQDLEVSGYADAPDSMEEEE